MRKLLIVVDMQNDFLTGALSNPQGVVVLPVVKAEIERFHRAGMDVVFTRDTHGSDYLTTQEGKNLPVAHCIKDTWGWEIADGLYAGERVFDKPVFGSVELASFVQKEGYEEVTLVGVCTDICVISNAFLIKAFCPECKVKIKADACAGVTKESHETALEASSACQIEII